jgi:intracellular sulfur oxidation DsrE/DsrF family protein
MIRIGSLAIAAIAGLAMSLLIAPIAQAQQDDQPTPQASKQYRVSKQKPSRPNHASRQRDDQASKQKLALVTKPTETARKPHQLLLQVNSNEPAMMNLALNNASNVAQYYRDLGEEVSIEVVTFGPGLHMLRDDTSPVKARIEALSTSNPEISFKACGNTQQNMSKAENRDITLIPQATIVKSGVVRVIELQEKGWTYVKL